MLGKITKTAVERLPPGGEWLWDSIVKGFGARRQTDGIFYYIRYRLNGRQHIKSLGRHVIARDLRSLLSLLGPSMLSQLPQTCRRRECC